MQIVMAVAVLAGSLALTFFLYAPIRCLRFVARHCLLQARGLEARERAIQAERAAVWEVV